MTNVLIVDDSRIVRERLTDEIEKLDGYRVAAAIENAANAEIACMKGTVNLILMDVCTADSESGLRAAAKIKKHYPELRVIIMTSMPEASFLQKAKAAGCESFWYKESQEIRLLDVMDRTMAGERVYPSASPVLSIGNAASSDFSARELEVLRDLSQGYKYEEIADHLGISSNTVKYHIKNLLSKTGYRNTLQLVVDVVDKKLILPKY